MNGFQIEAADREREKMTARIAELEKLVYVPGLWKCAKCDFSLVQANLNASDGSVTARDEPGDKCPNCDSPLWRVTERDAGNDMVDRCDEEAVRAKAAEARVAELSMILERDRSRVAEGVTAIKKAVSRREWLTEGRGSYEWDDEKWKGEFSQALNEIAGALAPLAAVAADWSDCPTDPAAIAAARAMPPGSTTTSKESP